MCLACYREASYPEHQYVLRSKQIRKISNLKSWVGDWYFLEFYWIKSRLRCDSTTPCNDYKVTLYSITAYNKEAKLFNHQLTKCNFFLITRLYIWQTSVFKLVYKIFNSGFEQLFIGSQNIYLQKSKYLNLTNYTLNLLRM